MTLSLGIHLAVAPVSIGLTLDGVPLAGLFSCPDYDFSENLIFEIEKLCQLNHVALTDIGAIGIAHGPGSYTGLRVGITLAKIFSQVRDIPLYGFSTLEAFVFPYRFFDGVYLSVMKAFRQEVNAGLFAVHGGKVSRLTDDFVAHEDVLLKNLMPIQSTVYVVGSFSNSLKMGLAQNSSLKVVTGSVLNGATLAQMADTCYYAHVRGDFRDVNPQYSHKGV